MKKLILSSFTLVAFIFVSNSALAQFEKPDPKSATSTLGVSIATVMDINAVSTGLNLSFTTAGELVNGKPTVADAVVLTYKSNWESFISISATDFVSLSNNALTMPASIISYSTDGTVSAFPNIMLEGNAAQNLSGTPTTGNVPTEEAGIIKLAYKITPTLKYAPASDYQSTITYTITAN